MIISKPKTGEYPEFMQKYIDNLPNDINLVDHLIGNLNSFVQLLESIPEDKLLYRYQEGKWTIKEVLLHIIDCERVFTYRTIAYARGDQNKLASFDENMYADNSNANTRDISDLIDELKSVRLATISLFKSLKQEQFGIVGKTSETQLSVSALAFVILGHAIHHIKIIQERYLQA